MDNEKGEREVREVRGETRVTFSLINSISALVQLPSLTGWSCSNIYRHQQHKDQYLPFPLDYLLISPPRERKRTALIFATVLGKSGFILNFPPAFRTTASSEMIVLARISSFVLVYGLIRRKSGREQGEGLTEVFLAKLALNRIYTPPIRQSTLNSPLPFSTPHPPKSSNKK
jgi:hypothetical protein